MYKDFTNLDQIDFDDPNLEYRRLGDSIPKVIMDAMGELHPTQLAWIRDRLTVYLQYQDQWATAIIDLVRHVKSE